MPKSFLGTLDTGIALTNKDGHERAQYIYYIMGDTSATKIYRGTKTSVGLQADILLEAYLHFLIPPPLKPRILTHWHTHPSGVSLPSTKDILFMLWKKSTFFIIGSYKTNSLLISTQKSRSYCNKNGHTRRSIKRMLIDDLKYHEMNEREAIRCIKSFGFGVYHQVKHNSDTDCLWKKSR